MAAGTEAPHIKLLEEISKAFSPGKVLTDPTDLYVYSFHGEFATRRRETPIAVLRRLSEREEKELEALAEIAVDKDVADDINELDMSGATAVLIDEFAHPAPTLTPEGITYDGQYLWTCAFNGNWIWKIDIGDPGPVTAFWDFEDGWQGWTHTSAFVFPAAWDVVTTTYAGGPYWTYQPPPDAGDSAFIIDSDSDYGANWVHDTAMSPPVANPGFNLLKYGFYLVSDDIWVLLREHSGGVWGSWTAVASYSGTTGPQWDSVDITAYTGDSIQVGFRYDDLGYWGYGATFDNVGFYLPPDHDVGCSAVVSPPEGSVAAADYDVIGRIRNYGGAMETFDVTANVYDTVGMVNVFTQTVTLTDFPVGGDSNVNFGTVTFNSDSYYYTEIFTELMGDADPANDTCAVYSTTAMVLGDIVFVIDTLETITGWGGHYGIEFDGTYFYISSAFGTYNAIHVIDTLGNLVWTIPNGTVTTYGMRDLAWDGVYTGPDRIDTLWASDENGNYKFGLDLTTGTFNSYGSFNGPPITVCRALGWDDDDEWFFTANWDPCYKFSKTNPNIQMATGPTSCYGAAYDTDDLEGGYVWWHGQTGPYSAHLTQMNPGDMTLTGVELDINHGISGGTAGGLCFYEGFRNMDVLFALVQTEGIYGIYVRDHVTGVEEQPSDVKPLVFGFAPNMANPVREHAAISYITSIQSHVTLKVYDGTGRLVETLVNSVMPAGTKTVNWDVQNVSNGIYFLRLEAENNAATHKMILVK